MTKYFFIFGRTPNLSKVELESVFRGESIEFKKVIFSHNVFVIESKNKIPTDLFGRLGGSVKFGQIIFESEQLKPEALIELLNINKQKITFGLSNYSNQNFNVRRLGLELKKLIKQKVSCRFVSPKSNELSAVAVTKNKLITVGTELCFFHLHGMFMTGKTLAVQNFERWNKLDYGRPEFDPKIGMLPPKIAQIMINLIPQKTNNLWDPFCGFGTIPQQGAVSGFEKIIGSDKNLETVVKAQKNIDWLKKTFKINSQIQLLTHDILKISRTDLSFLPDAVVTEPFLGKPLSGREKRIDLDKIKKDLEELYFQTFEKFQRLLAPSHSIVFIFPKFKFGKTVICLNIDNRIIGLGYKLIEDQDYTRPTQHLIRRITVWQKTNK
ncbi:MAG: TRM11 family SAM-dependent methyltransferase [Patescibacteria group bacterium]